MLSEIELLKLEFQRQILSGKLNFSATEIFNIINHTSTLTQEIVIKENNVSNKKLCKYHN